MAMSRGSKIFLVLLVLGLVAVGGVLAYASYLLGGEPGEGEPVTIEVKSGATANGIGIVLSEQDVVRSALAFRLVARSKGLDSQLQAGTYELETGMTVEEAIDGLLAGPREAETFRVLVPEGLTVLETLERLAAQSEHNVEDYRAVLEARSLSLPEWVPDLSSFGPDVREPYEGLLFPETYDFKIGTGPQQILQRMVDQLAKTVDAVAESQVQEMEEAGYSRYEVLIAASLIERETRVDDERGTVAGVVFNRLEAERPLQIDATVLYALGPPYKDRVLFEDLEVESPYNTYQVTGLPPTPISGVGRASIQAAFDPLEVEFLYYVLDADCSGRHVFSTSLEEHNRNVKAFRDAGRCQ